MSRLLYYFVLIPLSLLPFSVLYLISDFFFVLVYRVFGYRKKVVFQNLRNSFPEKSDKELEVIAQKFYHHLCDIIIESVKTFTISGKELKERMKYTNIELIDPYFDEQRSIIAITAHYNCWEWGAVVSGLYFRHKPFGIYQPLKDKFLDRKLRSSRNRFGITMFPVKETGNYFDKYKNQPIIVGFVADQTPSNPNKCHWMKFMNQDTPVLFGAEKYAKEYDAVPIFCEIQKIKRGFYETTFHILSENPTQDERGFITETHTHVLEALIKEKPEYWLWSHRRWKHKKPSDVTLKN